MIRSLSQAPGMSLGTKIPWGNTTLPSWFCLHLPAVMNLATILHWSMKWPMWPHMRHFFSSEELLQAAECSLEILIHNVHERLGELREKSAEIFCFDFWRLGYQCKGWSRWPLEDSNWRYSQSWCVVTAGYCCAL